MGFAHKPTLYLVFGFGSFTILEIVLEKLVFERLSTVIHFFCSSNQFVGKSSSSFDENLLMFLSITSPNSVTIIPGSKTTTLILNCFSSNLKQSLNPSTACLLRDTKRPLACTFFHPSKKC